MESCRWVSQELFNRRYFKDTPEGGPYRSDFWVQIFVLQLHWAESLKSQIFLKSVQSFLRYGHFLILALKWGQIWGNRKKSPFLVRILYLLKMIIWQVKISFAMYFGCIKAQCASNIKYRKIRNKSRSEYKPLPIIGRTKLPNLYNISRSLL